MKTYQQKGNDELLILNHKTSAKVLITNVILIKGDVNYTKFYMNGGREKLVAHSIKFFETYLETHGFLRVHRAFMINPNYIIEYDSRQAVLTMTNGQKATVSRRRKQNVKHSLVCR
jgi:two-component system LytT family response regulator